MYRKLLGALAVAALCSQMGMTAMAQTAGEFQSVIAFKGQTMKVPVALGLLHLARDCDPEITSALSLPELFCHGMDGAQYDDLQITGTHLTFYDTSLLPKTSSEPQWAAFIRGLDTFTKILDSELGLEAYGARSTEGMQFLPPMTRNAQTVSIADIRILKHAGSNVGIAYIAADGTKDLKAVTLYADFVFRLPGTKLLGIYSMPVLDAEASARITAQITGSTLEDRMIQLDDILQTYATANITNKPTYTNMYNAVQEMLGTIQARPFIDVFSTTPYAEAIFAMQARGIIQGYSNGSYKPNNSVNRAEFMKILLEAAGARNLESFASKCFPDVDAAQWYAKYVCYGKNQGIIGGYADGTFRPEATINLAEALKIVFKSYNINVGTDAGEWYQPYLTEARKRGMLVLIQAQVGDAIMRGEMAELMYRLESSL